eukprot:jgi/Mesvir1/9002/Mv21291-RA.1
MNTPEGHVSSLWRRLDQPTCRLPEEGHANQTQTITEAPTPQSMKGYNLRRRPDKAGAAPTPTPQKDGRPRVQGGHHAEGACLPPGASGSSEHVHRGEDGCRRLSLEYAALDTPPAPTHTNASPLGAPLTGCWRTHRIHLDPAPTQPRSQRKKRPLEGEQVTPAATATPAAKHAHATPLHPGSSMTGGGADQLGPVGPSPACTEFFSPAGAGNWAGVVSKSPSPPAPFRRSLDSAMATPTSQQTSSPPATTATNGEAGQGGSGAGVWQGAEGMPAQVGPSSSPIAASLEWETFSTGKHARAGSHGSKRKSMAPLGMAQGGEAGSNASLEPCSLYRNNRYHPLLSSTAACGSPPDSPSGRGDAQQGSPDGPDIARVPGPAGAFASSAATAGAPSPVDTLSASELRRRFLSSPSASMECLRDAIARSAKGAVPAIPPRALGGGAMGEAPNADAVETGGQPSGAPPMAAATTGICRVTDVDTDSWPPLRKCDATTSPGPAMRQMADVLAAAERAREGAEARTRELEALLDERDATIRQLAAQAEQQRAAAEETQRQLEESRAAAAAEKEAASSRLAQAVAAAEAACEDVREGERRAVARADAMRDASLSLRASLQEFKSQMLQMRGEVEQQMRAGTCEAHSLATSLADTVARLDAEQRELKSRYAAEMKERRALYNQVLELRGNIRVFCRVRPLWDKEVTAGLGSVAEFDPVRPQDIAIRSAGAKKVFKFDVVFPPTADQAHVFEETSPVVTSVLDGYNVCIFAYGQTGSGKTHTMTGPPEDRGVNHRTLEELFGIARKRGSDVDYTLQVSMVEVYNEIIRDLLGDDCKKRMELRHDRDGQPLVAGVTEVDVTSLAQVWDLLQKGSKARVVGATNANEHSSRSHSLLCIKVRGKSRVDGTTTIGKLWLVDLAGSERVGKTGVTGDRLKEAQHINKSLSALGDVIAALAANKGAGGAHIPYRNSKLTHLLADSLGGNAKVLMFVQVSPSDADASETLCSLQFASRAKGVELGVAKRSVDSGELAKLKAAVSSLKEDLRLKEEALKHAADATSEACARLKAKEEMVAGLSDKVRAKEGVAQELERQLHKDRRTMMELQAAHAALAQQLQQQQQQQQLSQQQQQQQQQQLQLLQQQLQQQQHLRQQQQKQPAPNMAQKEKECTIDAMPGAKTAAATGAASTQAPPRTVRAPESLVAVASSAVASASAGDVAGTIGSTMMACPGTLTTMTPATASGRPVGHEALASGPTADTRSDATVLTQGGGSLVPPKASTAATSMPPPAAPAHAPATAVTGPPVVAPTVALLTSSSAHGGLVTTSAAHALPAPSLPMSAAKPPSAASLLTMLALTPSKPRRLSVMAPPTPTTTRLATAQVLMGNPGMGLLPSTSSASSARGVAPGSTLIVAGSSDGNGVAHDALLADAGHGHNAPSGQEARAVAPTLPMDRQVADHLAAPAKSQVDIPTAQSSAYHVATASGQEAGKENQGQAPFVAALEPRAITFAEPAQAAKWDASGSATMAFNNSTNTFPGVVRPSLPDSCITASGVVAATESNAQLQLSKQDYLERFEEFKRRKASKEMLVGTSALAARGGGVRKAAAQRGGGAITGQSAQRVKSAVRQAAGVPSTPLRRAIP